MVLSHSPKLSRFLWREIPGLNKDVANLIFSLTLVVFGLTLMAMGKGDSMQIMPMVTMVIGHYYGGASKPQEWDGKNRRTPTAREHTPRG